MRLQKKSTFICCYIIQLSTIAYLDLLVLLWGCILRALVIRVGDIFETAIVVSISTVPLPDLAIAITITTTIAIRVIMSIILRMLRMLRVLRVPMRVALARWAVLMVVTVIHFLKCNWRKNGRMEGREKDQPIKRQLMWYKLTSLIN